MTAALSDIALHSSAAEALGIIGDPSAIPALAAGFTDEDPSIRKDAALALGRIGDPAAVQVLTTALADESPIVRLAAVYSLRGLSCYSVSSYCRFG